jgi:hypothetical protein
MLGWPGRGANRSTTVRLGMSKIATWLVGSVGGVLPPPQVSPAM